MRFGNRGLSNQRLSFHLIWRFFFLCRLRIRLLAYLWPFTNTYPWIPPISTAPGPDLRQRMGVNRDLPSFPCPSRRKKNRQIERRCLLILLVHKKKYIYRWWWRHHMYIWRIQYSPPIRRHKKTPLTSHMTWYKLPIFFLFAVICIVVTAPFYT